MTSIWDVVVGQSAAVNTLTRSVSQPLHAYLFVGPEGCGKEEAARAFAAHVLSGTDDPTNRVCSLVMRNAYVDVHEFVPDGNTYLVKEDIDEMIRIASTTPVESTRKFLVIRDTEALTDECAAKILKTIEEPSDGVFFILLADDTMQVQQTIMSRCAVVHLTSVSEQTVFDALVKDGVTTEHSHTIARVARGNMTRARVLASDSQLFERLKFFSDIPHKLNGSGAVAAQLVDTAISLIDTAMEPLVRTQELEIEEWEQRMSLLGGRKRSRKQMDLRHKREIRKYRTDEIRTGFVEMASVYRDVIIKNPDHGRPDALVRAIERLHEASGKLSLNVGEALLLREVIWSLPSLSTQDTLVFD